MINKPLISIITPTYNHEDFISNCIDSVLAQDYQNWEQIIIDDGSTDSTERIISKYEDERIIYIKQKNKGIWNLYENYNKALKNSKGDLIAILEGDDFWPPSKLSKQLIAFKDPEVVLSWGNAYFTKKNGDITRLYNQKKFNPHESILGNRILNKLFLTNFIPACTVLCKKDALIKIGGFKQPTNSPCVDYSTWLNLSKLGSFYYIDDILGYYRQHMDQASSKNVVNMIKYNSEYSVNFFNSLSIYEKDLLSVNLQNIIKHHNNTLMEVYFDLGRKSLNEKEWVKSREYFKKSLNGSNMIKFYTSICIVCSFLKIDFEKLVLIFNKTHIRN